MSARLTLSSLGGGWVTGCIMHTGLIMREHGSDNDCFVPSLMLRKIELWFLILPLSCVFSIFKNRHFRRRQAIPPPQDSEKRRLFETAVPNSKSRVAKIGRTSKVMESNDLRLYIWLKLDSVKIES
jgi:hypothetical protein